MKRQYLHEHHRRLDKALKPVYRDEMYGKGRSGPVPFTAVKATASQAESAKREEASRQRKATFRYKGFKFRFDWNLRTFADSNKLPLSEVTTSDAFRELRMIADKDFYAITDAIYRGAVWPFCYKGKFLCWRVKWTPPRTDSSVGIKQHPYAGLEHRTGRAVSVRPVGR